MQPFWIKLSFMYEINRQNRIRYISRWETIPDDWVVSEGESFSKSFMVVGIISKRGTVPLLRVQARVKINAEYYVNYVLKPQDRYRFNHKRIQQLKKVLLVDISKWRTHKANKMDPSRCDMQTKWIHTLKSMKIN